MYVIDIPMACLSRYTIEGNVQDDEQGGYGRSPSPPTHSAFGFGTPDPMESANNGTSTSQGSTSTLMAEATQHNMNYPMTAMGSANVQPQNVTQGTAAITGHFILIYWLSERNSLLLWVRAYRDDDRM